MNSRGLGCRQKHTHAPGFRARWPTRLPGARRTPVRARSSRASRALKDQLTPTTPSGLARGPTLVAHCGPETGISSRPWRVGARPKVAAELKLTRARGAQRAASRRRGTAPTWPSWSAARSAPRGQLRRAALELSGESLRGARGAQRAASASSRRATTRGRRARPSRWRASAAHAPERTGRRARAAGRARSGSGRGGPRAGTTRRGAR